MAATAEHAERGGARGGIPLFNQLSLAQRATVERIETSFGSPPRTIMLRGWRVPLEDAPKVPRPDESQTQGVTEQQI